MPIPQSSPVQLASTPLTTYMVDRYKFRPGTETIKAMAENLGMTVNAVYARLWRAGVLRKESTAMYHSSEEIVAAYARLGSLAAVVRELGVQFYTARDILTRNQVPLRGRRRGRPRPPKVPPEVVRATIQTLRAHDVEWRDIAKRLGISPGTLWAYRKQIEAAG